MEEKFIETIPKHLSILENIYSCYNFEFQSLNFLCNIYLQFRDLQKFCLNLFVLQNNP